MADFVKLNAVMAVIEEVAALRKASDDSKFKGLYWDQGDWLQPLVMSAPDGKGEMCGTGMCFAGWTLFLEGYTDLNADAGVMVNPKDGTHVGVDAIPAVARGVLDLHLHEADRLFSGGNDIHRLYDTISDIAEGLIRPYDPEDYAEYEDEDD